MNPKKSSYSAKKVWLGFRGFRTRFFLLTTPYLMFEGKKKLKFLLLIRSEGRNSSNTKKSSYSAKKVWLGFRGFCMRFLLLTTPYVMFEGKKNSNSYCSSKGRNRLNLKKSSYSAKKVRLVFRGFRTKFLLLTTPYVMFEGKKKLKFLLLIRRKK